MSFIKFESSRVKEEERRGIREAREKVLDKAKKDYFRRKEEEIQAKLRGDDKWMLPSVESRLSRKSKKKHKKKSKHKKKKSKSRKRSSSSSSESDSEEEEWVEKGSSHMKEISINCSPGREDSKSKAICERDEWMNLPGMIPCVSRQELKQNKQKEQSAEDQKNLLDKPGQSTRELNPYWKDGGTGLPDDVEDRRGVVARSGVGDKGADWLRKALRRAQEQAEEEGRSLEDVVAERWGSLEKLKSMIQEAECRRRKDSGQYAHNSAFPLAIHDSKDMEGGKGRREKGGRMSSGPCHHTSSSHHLSRAFRKPREDDERGSGEGSSQGFRKPMSDGDCHIPSSATTSLKSLGNWRKKDVEREPSRVVMEVMGSKQKEDRSSSSDENSGLESEGEEGERRQQLLTDQEMNELGAKLVKAEILGNEGLARELKSKLEKAREIRKKLKTIAVEEGGSRAGNERDVGREEVVVLTRTTSKGFARPVVSLEEGAGHKKRKGAKVETHMGGKRVRYFADDDKYSLKDMYEREKLNTVDDSNEMFSKLAAKGVGKTEGVNDMDDVFEENARFMKSAQREGEVERGRAVTEHRNVTKALDGCHWCLDSKLMLKHLIVAIGTKAYLCLPGHQSLTEGHCLIVPMGHIACGTMVDEDVWTEIQEFRKTLTRMFLAMDKDCIFFETAIHFKRFPHMVLECVPMEKETGDLAPIYFKKAIQECEKEWSNNKKVIDLANKDVRRAVPKGLPYFSVDFGLQCGFAHVIEEEYQWPNNFAQEIIGGMLDLDHHLWRKRRTENFDKQRKKVVEFSKWWKDYDWTQRLKE